MVEEKKRILVVDDERFNLNLLIELLKPVYTVMPANPMSGLPGNNSVADRIRAALESGEDACVIYSDLDNFKAFNDKYGFARGDEVLLFTAGIIKDAVAAVDSPDAFAGHIGGDDFLVVVPSHRAGEIADAITRRFDGGIAGFYSAEDAAAKCIHSVNRGGEPKIFPIMSVSLAGVDLSHRVYKRYVEVNDACAGAKKKAKEMPGSGFFMDRRNGAACLIPEESGAEGARS